MIDRHEDSYARSTNSTRPTGGVLLKTVVDAMLDSLTLEQQTKMASYLLRATRRQNGTAARIGGKAAMAAGRLC